MLKPQVTIHNNSNRDIAVGVDALYTNNGDEKIVSAEHVLFSNPLLDFIKFYKEKVPGEVIVSASNLEYRNHISVHLTVDQKLFDDNWIYIHSPNIKMARIADFTNFSK